MALSISLCISLIAATVVAAKYSPHPLSDDFISHINSKQNSWKSGRNFPSNTPLTYIKGLMGVKKNPLSPRLPSITHDAEFIASLPDSFDPREKWTNCPSLNEIRDQGSCGSCWAFGAVEVMTDRVCTYSNGAKQFHYSAQDLVSCCAYCGCGCEGGQPSDAFKYWKKDGIVSGGQYNSSQGCRPYEIAACEHHVDGPRPKCHEMEPTPVCVDKCEAGYKVEYEKDKHRAKKVYSVSGEDNIKAELYKNGPVEADFLVYADFLNYKSGVYSHTSGDKLDGHAIKILGWGVENGKKYWLCANSWNNDWGHKGYFKFLRGENHCEIEADIVAGEPDLDNL